MGKARKPSAFTFVLQALGAAEYICITRLHMVARFTHTLGCHIMHDISSLHPPCCLAHLCWSVLVLGSLYLGLFDHQKTISTRLKLLDVSTATQRWTVTCHMHSLTVPGEIVPFFICLALARLPLQGIQCKSHHSTDCKMQPCNHT